jgi:hypothetical protein
MNRFYFFKLNTYQSISFEQRPGIPGVKVFIEGITTIMFLANQYSLHLLLLYSVNHTLNTIIDLRSGTEEKFNITTLMLLLIFLCVEITINLMLIVQKCNECGQFLRILSVSLIGLEEACRVG